MASVWYKDHLVIWAAEYDDIRDEWRPDVIISWSYKGTRQFHRISGPPIIFQKEALELAKRLGEAWVNQKP